MNKYTNVSSREIHTRKPSSGLNIRIHTYHQLGSLLELSELGKDMRLVTTTQRQIRRRI